jgi:V/A-type H+-transporting ATPase subunit D
VRQDLKPTRAELRETKRKLIVVRRGHKLLKRKQESLMVEFLRGLDSYKKAEKAADEVMEKSRYAQAIAEMVSGRMGIWSFAMTRAGENAVEMGRKFYMGVKLPEIRSAAGARPLFIPGEPPQCMESAIAADELVHKLIELASIEGQVRVLLDEIERTKRRVNALELRIIPSLEEDQRFIQAHLEEMEREGLFSLKRIRAKLAANEAAENAARQSR